MGNALKYGLLALSLSVTGCASGMSNTAVKAPEPVKAIDPGRLYNGTWYEVARTPMKLTDGCVAGTTKYFQRSDGQLIDRDACRTGTPTGPERVIEGPVSVLNPGQNNKVVVYYSFLGVIPIERTYWMLDHGDDYDWFIEAGPSFENISIFTRAPRPSAAQVTALAARAKALGYDGKSLEYPEQFPAAD